MIYSPVDVCSTYQSPNNRDDGRWISQSCFLFSLLPGCGSTCSVSSRGLFHKSLLIVIHPISCTTGSTTGTLAPIALFCFTSSFKNATFVRIFIFSIQNMWICGKKDSHVDTFYWGQNQVRVCAEGEAELLLSYELTCEFMASASTEPQSLMAETQVIPYRLHLIHYAAFLYNVFFHCGKGFSSLCISVFVSSPGFVRAGTASDHICKEKLFICAAGQHFRMRGISLPSFLPCWHTLSSLGFCNTFYIIVTRTNELGKKNTCIGYDHFKLMCKYIQYILKWILRNDQSTHLYGCVESCTCILYKGKNYNQGVAVGNEYFMLCVDLWLRT